VTRSNRILNRLLILQVGIVAIGVGGALELPVLRIQPLTNWAPTTATLWACLVACLIIIVLSVLWIATRGRGRTSELLTLVDDTGSVTIDTRVAADLLADTLNDNPHVLSVGSGSYRVRGTTVLSLRVITSTGADLPALISSVGRAVEELDDVLERRVPVLLHLVSGLSAREVRTR
jgi:hypothetical protein